MHPDDPQPEDPQPEDPESGGRDDLGPDVDVDAVLDDHDAVLEAAGARLREDAHPLSPTAIQVSVLRRRSRRLTAGLAAAVLVIAVGAGGLALRDTGTGSGGGGQASNLARNVRPSSPAQKADVEDLVASLAQKPPIDPTTVKLVSSVSTFSDCDALIGDLRTVGAKHIGSRGFGGFDEGVYPLSAGYRARFNTVGAAVAEDKAMAPAAGTSTGTTGAALNPSGETLGTNVQVVGVDELDSVKAVGKLIYDLDGKGHLRITDANTLEVRAVLDVTPLPIGADATPRKGEPRPQSSSVSQLLVAGDRVVIFGSETLVSKPVPGDPSATRSSTSYLTVTFVDASDPTKPKITDRVHIEGALVSARMVNGQVRLVTTSNMDDLGFVVPTTPNSVAKALEENRRSVASSTAADWIPDWQRAGSAPQPLVPCDRVHVPDTFSGVAMTSMVTFPVASGQFQPAGTSILAPGDTLYAGLDTVAISSQVWVDPIDQNRLKFPNWQTAIHEFTFRAGEAPAYEGSGIVDGSTVGQFAFGEIGPSLAVVTTKGTPWSQDQKKHGVDLTVFTPDGKQHLTTTSKITDLSGGKGTVSAVRFVTDRVLISTGFAGRQVVVIDVSHPASPRRAGTVVTPGNVEYFHPLPDGQALVIGSRSDTVGTGKYRQSRSWVQASLLDVKDADHPKVINTWEHPWTADQVGQDHHTFTYWPARHLAMWGLQDTHPNNYRDRNPNHVAVLGITDAVHEAAVPVVSQPDAVPSPCPSVPVPAAARYLIESGGVVLRCDDAATRSITWPRYQCYKVDHQTVARYLGTDQQDKAYFSCNLAPMPSAARVLVVSGRPILYTDQTLEVLDPTTFASVAIAYHPNATNGYYVD